MNIAGQVDAGKIEKVLLEAFSMDAFRAYDVFRIRVWLNDQVDVLLTDLVRLAHMAELSDQNIIKRAFVMCLPVMRCLGIVKKLVTYRNIRSQPQLVKSVDKKVDMLMKLFSPIC